MNIEKNNMLKKRTVYLSIISNTILVVLKLAVGLYISSVSLVSEAMHSGVDLLAALIAFWAVHKASIPPDEKYDYGYGKFENLSAAIEASLIVVAAFMIIYEAVSRFRDPVQVDHVGYGMAIMLISIIINLLVSHRLIVVGKRTNSQALEADGLHLKSDVWTSVGVLGGLVGMDIFGYKWIDPIAAIVVAVLIFHTGYGMIIKSTRELTDASLSPEVEDVIRHIIVENKAVLGYHNLRTRALGPYKMIDAHINFNKDMSLGEVHAICDEIEDKIQDKLGQVDIIIHPEPIGADSTQLCAVSAVDLAKKQMIAKEVKGTEQLADSTEKNVTRT